MSKSLWERVCSPRRASTPHPPSIQISMLNVSSVLYRSMTSMAFMSLEQQRFLWSHSYWFIEFRQSLRSPQLLKLFDCRRGVACIVVVGVREHSHATLPHLVAKIYPAGEFSRAVYHDFVPGRSLLFDTLAITEPSDVRPIGSDRIEFQVCRAWHK